MQLPRENAISDEGLSHMADPESVFRGLCRLLRKGVKSRGIAVYLYDHELRAFGPALTVGSTIRSAETLRELPLPPSAIGHLEQTLRQKKSLSLTVDSADMVAAPLLPLLKRQSFTVVPMFVRHQFLGVVFIAGPRAGYSQKDLEFIREMVDHATMVISQIRLFDATLDLSLEMAKRIDVIVSLDEVNRAISSSLSTEKIIKAAMENIGRIIGCDLVSVLVEESGNLVVLASRVEGVTLPEQLETGVVLREKGLVTDVREKGEKRYLPELGSGKTLPPLEQHLLSVGIQSLLATPMMTGERATGVLLVGDRRQGQFAGEDIFAVEKIAAQVGVALHNAHLYEEMRTLFISTIASLANAIDAKSSWTKGHSERVMRTAAVIAEEMGLSEEVVERVRLGGLLHDIGKIGVIEAVLEKPAELSENEFPPLRLHPTKGVAILAPIAQLKDVLPGILHHHEHYDGTGYPGGLAGEKIPLEARIISVADAFDAMVAERPYKKGYPIAAAMEELQRCAGSQFDPQVVDVFTAYLARKASRHEQHAAGDGAGSPEGDTGQTGSAG